MGLVGCKTNAFAEMVLGTQGRRVKAVRLIAKFWYRILLMYMSPTPPMPAHVLMNFRGFPPGCGDSVADF